MRDRKGIKGTLKITEKETMCTVVLLVTTLSLGYKRQAIRDKI